MIRFDQALAMIADRAHPLGSEQVPLDEAEGRVLAEALVARLSAPARDSSAMDGYALREADLGNFPLSLKLAGRSAPAAAFDGELGSGECVRIFTGAPVPEGADRVVVQELARRDGESVVFEAPPGDARHIRRLGSDFAAGDVLLKAGRRLDARALVTAAAADCAWLTVWRKPRVAIVGTGDELVAPGEAGRRPGSVPESISLGVATLARMWGAEIVDRLRLPDDLPMLERESKRLLVDSDLLIVTGGASVGEHDHARAMFGPALELVFSKIAIKPGKPVWLGRAGRSLILGLPGNPSSAMITARLLLAPLLAGLTGRDPAEALRWRKMGLAAPLAASGDRETFVTAAIEGSAVRPLTRQDSSGQRSLAAAEALIRRLPYAEAAPAGAEVEVIDF